MAAVLNLGSDLGQPGLFPRGRPSQIDLEDSHPSSYSDVIEKGKYGRLFFQGSFGWCVFIMF